MSNYFVKKYKVVKNDRGNIYKILNQFDSSDHVKGDLYISQIRSNEVKAWRKHKIYKTILVAVSGVVQLKCINENRKILLDKELSLESGSYVQVDPGVWYGFKGVSSMSASIMALINGVHEENEVERLEYFQSEWK